MAEANFKSITGLVPLFHHCWVRMHLSSQRRKLAAGCACELCPRLPMRGKRRTERKAPKLHPLKAAVVPLHLTEPRVNLPHQLLRQGIWLGHGTHIFLQLFHGGVSYQPEDRWDRDTAIAGKTERTFSRASILWSLIALCDYEVGRLRKKQPINDTGGMLLMFQPHLRRKNLQQLQRSGVQRV